MDNKLKFCLQCLFVCLYVFSHSTDGAGDGDDDHDDDHGHHGEDHTATETALLNKLLSNYNVISLPYNADGPAQVKLGLALFKLVDMDEKHQILFTSIWMRTSWTDNRLKWNTSEFKIEDLHIPLPSIWRPDITLYNDVSEDEKSLDKYPAQVSPDGDVLWLAPVMIRSYCRLDVRYFPYDMQVCPLRFGSWSFHGDHLLLTNMTGSGDTSEFVDNGEWEVIDMPVRTSVKTYQCCHGSYPIVTYYIVMKRRGLYYVFNIIIPCILIVAVSLLSFYLPPESGEKVSLVVTVLLALTVFMLLIADIMPPQADVVPLIAIYFACIIALLCLTTTMTVMIINLQYSGNHGNRVPPWLKRILFGRLAKFLCLKEVIRLNLEIVKHSQSQYSLLEDHAEKITSSDTLVQDSRTKLNGKLVTSDKEGYSAPGDRLPLPEIEFSVQRARKLDTQPKKKRQNREEKLDKILNKLEIFDGDRRIKRHIELVSLEWELTVLVIDRLLLVIFVIMTVVLNIAFLLYRPDTSTYTLD